MNVCRVIVVGRKPLSLPFFDYCLPPDFASRVQPGQLVRVPFRTSFQYGIVHSIHATPPTRNGKSIALKEIVEIVHDQPALTLAQLSFIQEIAELYKVSPGFLIKSNLFEITKKNIGIFKGLHGSPDQKTITPTTPRLFIHHTEVEKKDYILQNVARNKQNLILVPEVHDVQKTAELLFETGNITSVALLSSETLGSEENAIWFSVWSGATHCVVGTRAALFLPWHDLENIFLLDEGNSSYKSWDMAPRFETRDAVKMLAQAHGAIPHFIAHTPSAETYYFAKKKIYSFASNTETPFTSANAECIDMQDEKRGRNYSFFADSSITALQEALKTGNALILANRKGSLSAVVCRDCGYAPTCPTCTRVLSYHETTGTLECHFCKTKKPLQLVCERCSSQELAPRGIGTQKVERELKKSLKDSPISITYQRIDGDTQQSKKMEQAKGLVIIGTEKALAWIDWQTITLVLFVDPDTLLFIPEYRLAEELWQTIASTAYHLPPHARLLLQTNHKDNPVFKYLPKPEQWYGKELLQRKFFGYTPFRSLLKLSYGGKSAMESERAAGALFLRLSSLTKRFENTIVMNPLPTNPSFYKKRYWQVIVIKVDYRHAPALLKQILPLVPDDWKVDVNPLHILGF